MAEEESLQGFCRCCRKPWKEILSAGAEYGVFEREGIEYTYHSVGSGVTEHRCIGFKTEADWLKLRKSEPQPPSTDGAFDQEIADIEQDAWNILKRAGLLNTPGEDYTLPGKQRTWRGLLHTIEERGFREYIDEEWYAAMILTTSAGLRDFITDGIWTKGTLLYAIIFGKLVTEAQIRFGYIKNQSQTGGVTRGKRQTATREPEWAKWQAAANEIWKKHPKWGKPAVASMVQKQFPNATERTIRLRIEKPVR